VRGGREGSAGKVVAGRSARADVGAVSVELTAGSGATGRGGALFGVPPPDREALGAGVAFRVGVVDEEATGEFAAPGELTPIDLELAFEVESLRAG